MLLATRCPFCETVFRIQPTQLAVRRGLVRCGHCQEAFDASGSLYEVPEGGDFSRAVPLAGEIAASLTAGPPETAPHAAAQSAAAPSAFQPAFHPDTQNTTQAAEPAVSAPSQDPRAPLHAAPNFTNRTWDPWAPPADTQLDPRLRYNADQLAHKGTTPSATPGAESKFIADNEPSHAASRAPAASATTASVPPAQNTQPGEPFPPAARWTRSEPNLGATGPVEPTFSANEASAAGRINDPEPALGPRIRQDEREPAFSALPPNDGASPFAVTREAPARPRGSRAIVWRFLGTLIAILLLALLAVQLAWWQRETVMVYWPDSQPLYQQACEQLGCRVLPPRDIDGLLVEPSDLRQVDNEPHHLELKVPLRNRFNVALAFPAIELSLLDRQNNIVVRRVLWPQDYVTPGTPIESGLPARTTQTMIVRLDTGDVVASNFRIEIFYP